MSRNIWCKNYSDCLEQAARDNEPFTCIGCKFEFDDLGKTDACDNIVILLLMSAIFFPEIAKKGGEVIHDGFRWPAGNTDNQHFLNVFEKSMRPCGPTFLPEKRKEGSQCTSRI